MDIKRDLTTEEVAAELGLHPDTVRRLILQEHIYAYKAGLRQWRVTRETLDEIKRNGVRRPGRPIEGTENAK